MRDLINLMHDKYDHLRIRFVNNFVPLDKSFFVLGTVQQIMWNYFFRWFISKDARWYFEGNRAIWGQLWLEERRTLYELVRQFKPKLSFEVGTWKGGGSTYFIAHALHDNGIGKLHTIELKEELHREAVASYQLHAKELLKFIRFHYGSSKDIYPGLLKEYGADFVFLDGIGAKQTLEDFLIFEPSINEGGIIIAHDWYNEKTSLLRPYLDSLSNWKPFLTLGPPVSVGLAVYIKKDGK